MYISFIYLCFILSIHQFAILFHSSTYQDFHLFSVSLSLSLSLSHSLTHSLSLFLCLFFPPSSPFLSLSALPDNCEFIVNFAPELSEVISETKYLEKLGYAIPELARSVALQEDKFVSFQDSLNHCLQRYHSALAQLSIAEVCTTEYSNVLVMIMYCKYTYESTCTYIIYNVLIRKYILTCTCILTYMYM